RLALAKLIYSRKNVLILDEPTNHLDIPAREALEAALQEYDGTIITVSHDRFFLDKLASQIMSFSPSGDVDVFYGNYTEYHDWKAETAPPVGREGDNAEATDDDSNSPEREAGSLSKNQRERLEKRMAEIEKEIADRESKSAGISEEMSRPEAAADHALYERLNLDYQDIELETAELYKEWEAVSQQLG